MNSSMIKTQDHPIKTAENFNEEGIDLFYQQNYADAIIAFTTAITQDPQNSLYHKHLGDTYFDLGQNTEGEKHYKKAIELEPMNLEILSDFATLLRSEGKIDEAIFNFNLCLKFEHISQSELVRIKTQLGKIYFELGDFCHAKTLLKEVQALEPTDPISAIYLGKCYYESKDIALSEQYYMKALNYLSTLEVQNFQENNFDN